MALRTLWIFPVPAAGLALAAAIAAAAPPEGAAPDAAGVRFFEARVRPVLVQRCYPCHSAGTAAPQGGLALDTRRGLMRGGASGPAVVPGDPDRSPLIQAIRFTGKIQMPPAGKLPEREIAALTEWVRLGAPDPREGGPAPAERRVNLAAERRHWAYQPLRPATPPPLKQPARARTPVDRFVLARLERAGLSPAPPAPRAVLLRRAALLLTGLPPEPAALQAFLHDTRPGAWERAVDRLLAAPEYGERWARHWLDLARFAESHGFEHDYDRPYAYHYRDFVIEALNRDMPYNQFVAWQLAGDELAPDDPLAWKATGFLAAGTHSTQITRSQVEKERYDELDDMVATTGTAMLGLTLGCARCHDHKYDPITAREYYRLAATFTTTVRSDYDVITNAAEYRREHAVWERAHASLTAARARYEQEELPRRLAEWLPRAAASLPAVTWHTLELAEPSSAGGARFIALPDDSWLAQGKNPDHDTYTLTAVTRVAGIRALRLEALAHPTLPRGGPGRAPNGNFALTDVRVTTAPLTGGTPRPLRLAGPRATFEQQGLPAAAAVDADPRSGWAVDPRIGEDHALVLPLEAPAGSTAGERLTVTLRFEGNTGHNLGRVRLSVATAGDAPPAAPARPEAVEALLSAPPAGGPDRERLLRWFATQDAGWRELDAAVQRSLAQQPRPRTEKMLISSEGVPAVRLHTQGGDFLPATHLLRRGDPSLKGEEVQPGFLLALTTAPGGEATWIRPAPAAARTSFRRAALAAWITDTRGGAGHLLARVIVNRLWQHHFGRGLVATPSDFGTQGARPTHPELLDYLAAELIRGGWRLKPLHRLLLRSAVWQQSSAASPRSLRVDPHNALLSRFARRRLEAESLRDSILAVSGQLDRTRGGPGTLDEGMKRRSIYFTVKRSRLIPALQVFDAPDALQGVAARPTTTVAPQALLLLNSPWVRESAAAFARRVAAATPETAVRRAYRLALCREPDATELAAAQAFLRGQEGRYAPAAGEAPPRLHALRDFCQVLFGLNEFAYVE